MPERTSHEPACARRGRFRRASKFTHARACRCLGGHMNTSLEAQIARMNAIMDKIDLGFVEAAHVDRERSYRIDAPAQVPMAKDNPEGKPSIEFYAPTQVSVLAYPVLYCLPCNTEHACAYTHK